MPHPSAAVLRTACTSGIGLAGMEIGGNINAEAMGHPHVGPIFAACVALQMSVFVHTLKPAGKDRLVGPAALQPGWGVFPTLKDSVAASPVEQACRMFCDTWVFDAPTLGQLMQTPGAQALAVGNARLFMGRAAAALPVALPETA